MQRGFQVPPFNWNATMMPLSCFRIHFFCSRHSSLNFFSYKETQFSMNKRRQEKITQQDGILKMDWLLFLVRARERKKRIYVWIAWKLNFSKRTCVSKLFSWVERNRVVKHFTKWRELIFKDRRADRDGNHRKWVIRNTHKASHA